MFIHDSRIQTPAGIAFASDPLLVSLSEGENVLRSGAGEEFALRLSSAGAVDISDVVEAWAAPLAEPSGPSWLERVESWGDDSPRRVFINWTGRVIPGGPKLKFATYVIPGRTSLQNLQMFAGSDIFARRLLHPQGNPFLTTRTHTGQIILKETELAPLYFVQDSEKVEDITIHTSAGVPMLWSPGAQLLLEPTMGIGVYTVDLKKARREIFERYGIIASEFAIRKGGRVAAEVFIEAAAPSKSRHLLRFRNSFGVFEQIELTGELTNEVQLVEADSFKKFRAEFKRFENDRRRAEVESVLTVATGPKRPDELLLLLDALASDEVWLLGYGLTPVRVIPEVKGVSMPERQEEPQSVDLTLRPVFTEPAVMPEVSMSNATYIRKIFNRIFDNNFS